MPNAVLFDLDNTLIDRDGAFQAVLFEAFPDPAVRARLTEVDRSGHGPRQDLWDEWRRHSREPMDQLELGRRLAAHLRPDPGLLRALQLIGVKLGLISNGGGPTQRRKLQAAGLEKLFPSGHVFISGEVGLEKPDPRIFWLTCQALAEKPQDCLYLGDQEEVDGRGARAAGLRFHLVRSPLTAGALLSLVAPAEEETAQGEGCGGPTGQNAQPRA